MHNGACITRACSHRWAPWQSLPPAAVPRTDPPTWGSPAPGRGRGLRPAGHTAMHSTRQHFLGSASSGSLDGRWTGAAATAAGSACCQLPCQPAAATAHLLPPAATHPQAKLREAAERRQAEERERLDRERAERERFERQAAEARARAAEEAERQRKDAP